VADINPTSCTRNGTAFKMKSASWQQSPTSLSPGSGGSKVALPENEEEAATDECCDDGEALTMTTKVDLDSPSVFKIISPALTPTLPTTPAGSMRKAKKRVTLRENGRGSDAASETAAEDVDGETESISSRNSSKIYRNRSGGSRKESWKKRKSKAQKKLLQSFESYSQERKREETVAVIHF
jgi:hypothetical protein